MLAVKFVGTAGRDVGDNTVTVVVALPVPDGPEQLITYVVVVAGDKICEPEVVVANVQPPTAEQDVVLVDVQVRVVVAPVEIIFGFAIKDKIGAVPPPPPPHAFDDVIDTVLESADCPTVFIALIVYENVVFGATVSVKDKLVVDAITVPPLYTL